MPNDEPESGDAEGQSLFGDVIYAYTRRQAIEDGILVDVTEAAREAGFRLPFAMTIEVWSLIETIPERRSFEDCRGRLRDVLIAAGRAVRAARAETDELHFEADLHHDRGNRLALKLHCGPGDQGESVVTLMLPDQD